MSKSKDTTLESPPKFLEGEQKPEPQEYIEVPVTNELALKQYELIEEALQVHKDRANVLSGMLTILAPKNTIGYNEEKRCFQVATPRQEKKS